MTDDDDGATRTGLVSHRLVSSSSFIARDLAPNGTLSLIKRAQAAGFTGTVQAYMDYPPDWMLVGWPDPTVRV